MCRNPVAGGQKITHNSNPFPLWCAISKESPTLPTVGQFLLIFQPDRTSSATISGACHLRKITPNKKRSPPSRAHKQRPALPLPCSQSDGNGKPPQQLRRQQ